MCVTSGTSTRFVALQHPIVVLYHAEIFKHSRFGAFFSLGPEAVIVFFVLSGFVISYATEGRSDPLTFPDYFLRRFKRIYPLFLVSLVFGYIAVSISQKRFAPVDFTNLIGNVFMLQDIKWLKAGAWVDTYQGNDALWSLSYEWWFYMAFAMLVWGVKLAVKLHKTAVLSLSVFATLSYFVLPSFVGLVLSYWFIWWCGVELSREFCFNGRMTWRRQLNSLVGMSVLTVLWGIPVALAALRHHPLRFGYEPVIELRHFLAADLVLLAVLSYSSYPIAGISTLLRPFLPIGQFSYALYIFHNPVLHLEGRRVRFIGVLLLLPACYFLEIVFQPYLNSWFPQRRRRPETTT